MKKLVLLTCSFLAFSALSIAQCTIVLQVTNVACCGSCTGTMTANVTGGTPPYTYLWMPGSATTQTITNLCEGTYTCTVTDINGIPCSASGTVTGPFSTFTTNVTNASCSTCCDGSITVTVGGGSPPYSYLWTPTNQTTQTATGLCNGSYQVCVTDANGRCCCSTAVVSFGTVINNSINNNFFTVISPNPSPGIFILQSTEQITQIEIYNMLGELISPLSLRRGAGGEVEINLSSQPSGIYFAKLKTENGILTKKIIKQ